MTPNDWLYGALAVTGLGSGWAVLAKRRQRQLRAEIEQTLGRAFNEQVEHKLAEADRQKALSGAILASLVESVIALDDQGRILFLNAAAERLFEQQSAAVTGRPYLEVLRHGPLNEILTSAFATPSALTREITLHSPSERTLSVQVRPFSYGQEQNGVLAALHDVTELRRLEGLRQEFVANVSHELKTPLTSIKGFVETLLQGALEDPHHNREFLKTILEHADHLSRLIDDVLDLSAIEARRVAYRFEAVSVSEVLGRILTALAPTAKARKISIRTEMPGDLPKVLADREKLAQILLNLIDNAIKFNCLDGRVEISARASQGQVSVRIADTGRGIPEADLPRVFERFYRADKSRSHEVPGTGLGLAIVKHLVEAHQGTVTAESRAGEGSTFTFSLPVS